MGAKKFILKTMIAGAVIGGVAAMLKKMKDNGQLDEIAAVTEDVKKKVVREAKKMGKLTQAAYEQIVDTTIAEFRGVKAMAEDDLTDLGEDLKASWADIQDVLMSAKDDAESSARSAVHKAKTAIKKKRT